MRLVCCCTIFNLVIKVLNMRFRFQLPCVRFDFPASPTAMLAPRFLSRRIQNGRPEDRSSLCRPEQFHVGSLPIIQEKATGCANTAVSPLSAIKPTATSLCLIGQWVKENKQMHCMCPSSSRFLFKYKHDLLSLSGSLNTTRTNEFSTYMMEVI